MAKATSPIRLQEDLMALAKLTASRFHRSTAEQIEYWAELGRSVASKLDPDVLLSISSGLATIKVEPVYSEPRNIKLTLPLCDYVCLLNNSSLTDPFQQVVIMKKGKVSIKEAPLPNWANEILVEYGLSE